MDYTSIFSVACTINRAETLKARNIQIENLKNLIRKALKNDQTHLIDEALDLCEKEGKNRELAYIQDDFIDLITTFYTNEEIINARTDLILIPVMLKSDEELVRMFNLKTLETKLETGLKENFFIPQASNLFLYSVFYNYQKVNSFSLADWYKLHSRMIFSRDKSMEQNVYNKNFGVPLKPGKAELFYFIALIYQNKKLVESVEPDLFDRRQMNLDDKKKFLNYINGEFKKISSKAQYEVLMPDNIFRTIEEGKFKYQHAMLDYFIGRKVKIPHTEFFIASMEYGIALFAYNNQTQKVYDKMLLNSYGTHDDQENIDNIFNALADNQTHVYIAKKRHDNSFFKNSDTFILEEYLKNNEYEKFLPNLLENNDIYL